MNHWLKLDHITFLAMLPVGLLMLLTPLAAIPFTALWVTALVYDLYEQKRRR